MKNRDCGSEKKLMKGEKLACVVCILGRPSTAGDCRVKVVKEKFQFSVDGGSEEKHGELDKPQNS